MYCGSCRTSTAKLFFFFETVMLLACLRPGAGGRSGVLVEAFLTTAAGSSCVRRKCSESAVPAIWCQAQTRGVGSYAFGHGHSDGMLGWSLRTLLSPARTSSWESTAHSTRLFASGGVILNDDGGWKVPKRISIPEDSLEMSFIKSSGAGGQNVNKVNTQVQIKLFIESTGGWIPFEVRQRLRQQQQNRINKEGYLVLQVQEHRTQTQNRKTAIAKLEEMILQAWVRPKIRHIRTGLSVKTKRQRREDKRKRSAVKEGRRRVDY